jgi:hypothetical protein
MILNKSLSTIKSTLPTLITNIHITTPSFLKAKNTTTSPLNSLNNTITLNHNLMTQFSFLTKADEKAIQEMINSYQSIFDDLTDQQIVAIYLNAKYDYVK